MTTTPHHVLSRALFVLAMVFVVTAGAQSDPKSARSLGIVPVHDSADIPFRRAPMGPSSRSIVVNLSTNVHLAFDAALMRTHTVWEGPSLNLFGPPFTDTATRFICDISGKVLWETLPVQPWAIIRSNGSEVDRLNTRFLGISTKGGETSFKYELKQFGALQEVEVKETPRLVRVLSRDAVVRHVAVGRLTAAVRFSPFYGAGEFTPLPGVENSVLIRREKDLLLVTASGLPANVLSAQSDRNPHAVLVQSERDGKGPYSAVLTNTTSGPQVEVAIALPHDVTKLDFEVAAVVCADQNEAVALAKAFAAPQAKSVSQAHRLQDLASPDTAFKAKPAGDASFTVEPFPLPKDIKLMIGGLDVLPNGDVALCTYSGEVWIVEGASGDPAKAKWRRFARGLNECGGLRVVNGVIYVTQKCELTRLTDTDKDGEADLFECISDGWGYTGNYHSFATGPALDPAGNFYVMVTGHRTIYDVPYMGWSMKISSTDSLANSSALSTHYRTEGFCSGLRVPNGFGEFQGEVFMTDNQGHWIAANKLNHLQPGKFYGHPSAQPTPRDKFDGDKDFAPPAVWFPYAWVKSASGMAEITDDRMGPYKGQLLVGEFQNACVMRVALEKVNGEYQGAVFQWVKGFGSGVNRLAFGPDRKLYVGGLRMGHWTSIGPRAYSLDRVSFTGKIPFEMKEVHAQPDGFVITFTKPVDAASAADAENWNLLQYSYAYDGKHGAPEKDRDEKIPGPPARITKVVVAEDKRSVRLVTEGLVGRNVIDVRVQDVTSAEGEKLRTDEFHYTLNQIPGR